MRDSWSARSTLIVVTGTAMMAVCTAAATADTPGLDELIDRLGPENVPTGASVVVGHVEAPTGSGDYMPNTNSDAFDGKTFLPQSGPSGNSGHATNVGQNFYGLNSIAPGIDTILNWEANNWLVQDLNGLGGIPDLPIQNEKIYNNSWIGTGISPAQGNAILRHADYAARNDQLIIVSGTANSGNTPDIMVPMHNGISVGRLDGGHAATDTPAGLDDPGRMKPEMVADANTTSSATPIVAAGAALMVDTARIDPCLIQTSIAERSDVIKAVLMAGAMRDDTWTNNAPQSGPQRGITDRPIDEIFGAGAVDVNIAHLILTGYEQDGSNTAPASDNIQTSGWDRAALDAGESRFYRFTTDELADNVSFLATWHRFVPSSFNSFLIANVDLTLWRVDKNNQLVAITGEAGNDVFASGNVVSNSDVDNVELVHTRDLQPGTYVLEVARVDSLTISNWNVAVAWHMPDNADVLGDLDGDGVVSVADLLMLLGNFGACADPCGCIGDLDNNQAVDVNDLLELLGNWG